MASKDNNVNYGTKEILGSLQIYNETPSTTQSYSEGLYVRDSGNNYSSVALGDADRLNAMALVHSGVNNTHNIELCENGTKYSLKLPSKSGTFTLKEDLKAYQGYTAADSRVVSDITDLNNANYCITGIYRGTGSSYTNCPTTNTFRLEVYSAEDASSIRNELTQNWVYRYRILTDFYGNQWVQNVHSANTAGSFIYGAWKRVVANAGATSVWANNITLTAGTWAIQVHISGTVQNFFVFIDETNNADANRFKNLKFYNQHNNSTYLQITSATIGGNYILTYYNADNTEGTGRINYKRLD